MKIHFRLLFIFENILGGDRTRRQMVMEFISVASTHNHWNSDSQKLWGLLFII